MKPETININARYYLQPSRAPKADEKAFDVIDRALEYNHRSAVVFSNGTEKECREWVERNCTEPRTHTAMPWRPVEDAQGICGLMHPSKTGVAVAWLGSTFHPANGFVGEVECEIGRPERQANAHLIATAPKLLALLEQYHAAMPTKESGALIAEARGWTIQE